MMDKHRNAAKETDHTQLCLLSTYKPVKTHTVGWWSHSRPQRDIKTDEQEWTEYREHLQ